MADPTHAEQMVAAIEAALLDDPLGESVRVGETSITTGDAIAKLNYWKSVVARENGTRRRITQQNLRVQTL